MTPLSECPRAALAGVRLVLTDLDDTLTTDGRLTATAYSAMDRLAQAGLAVVPVTGRPAGWCDHIARMWPVAGVVGENGAFYFAYDPATRRMIRRFRDDATTRAANRSRLDVLRDRILAAVPGAAVASDQAYREADLAIDFCEDVPRLPEPSVDRIAAIMSAAGMTAKVSSIHVNGWFGAYDKLSMTRVFVAERLGRSLDDARAEIVFVGDSPNDAPMFGFFPLSVGVANVLDFGNRLESEPRFVARARCGAGFAEVAEAILAAQRERGPALDSEVSVEGGVGAP